MTYYLVKLKPDCRWLDRGSDWTISKKNACRYGTRAVAHRYANDTAPDAYEAGDVVIVRVRTVRRKVIPVPKIEVQTPTCPGDTFSVLLNGVFVRTHIDTLSRAEAAANALRRALGIPEST